MAGFGLGLGAFTQGFANGVGLGQRWDQVRRQNSDRDAIDKVNTEAKSAFDADVAAGSTTPDKWNDYFSTNVLPKLSQTYAQQGNMEGARYAQQWGESEAAKKGVSAFGRLLTAGNFDEAGKAFADLGSAKGYLPGGFVYSGSEAVAGPNGQQGLKIMWRSPDGKAYSQQFGSIDELKQMAAGALNPEAVAKLHVDQMGWGAEDSRKLGFYRRQKEIDAQPGLQPVQPGFRWNADRTAQEPIPGGPAHPDYLGGKAQATQAPPAGFTQRQDGRGYVPVPGGPADPSYISAKTKAEAEAKVGPQNNPYATGAYTEGQGKAALFSDRMAEAEAVIRTNEDVNSGVSGWVGGMAANRLDPMAANQIASPQRQKVDQAQRNFVNSVLRRESGAVINPDEFNVARMQYFPQPGDSAQVIEQKRQNRLTAITGLMREAGPAYKPPKGWEDPSNPPKFEKEVPVAPRAAVSEPMDDATGQPLSSLPRPTSIQEFKSLPKGQRYVAPDGKVRVRQ